MSNNPTDASLNPSVTTDPDRAISPRKRRRSIDRTQPAKSTNDEGIGGDEPNIVGSTNLSAFDWQLPEWRLPQAYTSDPLIDAPEKARTAALTFGKDLAHRLRESYWRWEFLRRHPEYRRDWLTYRTKRIKGSEKYDIAGPWPDPRISRPWPLMFMRDLRVYSDRDFILSWGFDLTRPIEPQIRTAKKQLLATQKQYISTGLLRAAKERIKTRRQPPRRLIQYLRALDARDGAGATYDEIGRTVLGNENQSDAASLGFRLYNAAVKARERMASIRYGVDPTEFAFKPRR